MPVPELSPLEERVVLLLAQGRSHERGSSGGRTRPTNGRLAPDAGESKAREGIGTPRTSPTQREDGMTNTKAIFGSLITVAAAVVVLVCGVASASASSAPIVIAYAKTCVAATGHCSGTAGSSGTIEMQITSFQPDRQRRPADVDRVDHPRRRLVHRRAERALQPGRVHRAQRHGHCRLVRGRAGAPAKQPRRRRPEHHRLDRRAPTGAGEFVAGS